MKFRVLCSFCFLVVLACNKKDETSTNTPNNIVKLTNFSVNVLERTSISAIIQWDSSFNKVNNELVRYKVLLENVLVDSGITRLVDTLVNLEKNKTYKGKVVAYITGDSVFAEFSLSTYEGSIYAATRSNSFGATSRLGYFNGYPIPGLQVQPSIWRFDAGVLLEPTLSNDTLFIVSNNRLKAISAVTGNQFWQNSTTYTFNSSVTYSAGKLYACTNGGTVVCFNSTNGTVLWTYKSDNTFANLISTPVIDDNKVFVASTSSSGEITCIDANTGTKIWNFGITNSTCKRPVAVNGVVVFIIAMEGRVLALNQSSGSIKWDKKIFGITGNNEFNPVYVDGKVMVHTNGKLSALDLNTGNEVWKYDNGMSKWACIAGNDRVYICQDSLSGLDQISFHRNLLCFNAKDGTVAWRQSSKFSGHKYYRLVFGKDKIYATEENVFNPDFSRRIVAFNAVNGNRDEVFYTYNPVRLNLYEHVYDYCVKRDGIVYYPSTHGNYR